jgi:uncharacterized membrane protein
MPEITENPSTATPAPQRAILDQAVKNSPAPAKAVEVPGDAEKLTEWATLKRQLREANTKLTEVTSKATEAEKRAAELESLRGVADKAGTVERLTKEGKHLEAAKAAGLELEQAFAQWVEESEGKPGKAEVPQDVLDKLARVEAIEKRLQADDEAKAKADQEAKERAGGEQRAGMLKGFADKIAAEGSKWVRCAKDPAEASEHALAVVHEKARTVLAGRAADKGYDLAKLTAEQAAEIAITDTEAAELFDLSLDAVEAEYKGLGEKFYVPEPVRERPATIRPIGDYLKKHQADPNRESSPVVERKAAVTLDGQRGSLRTPKELESRGRLTADEAKAKALRSIRSMTQR